MICGWRARRGSDQGRPRRWGVLFAILALGWAGAVQAQSPADPVEPDEADAGSGIVRERAPRLELRWTRSDTPTDQERTWMKQDERWLRSVRQAVPLAQVTPDSTRLLRRLLRSAAAGDSNSAGRPLESRLRERWIERGYLGARVQALWGPRERTLMLDAGRPYRLAELEVAGGDFPGRDRLLAIWLPRPGDEFVPTRIREAVEGLLAGAGELGHPFARWVISSVETDPDRGEVRLRAQLLAGPATVLGPITSDLPAGTGARFLVRASGLRSGQLFRESDLRRAHERLLARDLYAQVDEPLVYATPSVDTVGIHFPVQPRRKANRAQVVLGLSRGEDDERSRLSGQVDLSLPNLAGTGRALTVGWQDDGADRSLFGFSYREPLAFGTPLDAGLALDHEVATDQFTRFRVENTWSLPVVALWGVDLGAGWDRTTFPAGDLEGTRRVRLIGAIEHRRGDRSRSGWAGRVGLETAWRSSLARSGADSLAAGARLGEEIRQRILLADLEGEKWLAGAWSVAGRISLRQLTGQEETAPLSEHFRFGGANSLRGYREDEFHGTTAGWSGWEVRIGRPRGSRLYTFVDVGYFEFPALDPLPDEEEHRSWKRDWPWGFGLGLLARTGGGDLSLAVGFPETVDFQIAKLHVSLMESF